MSKELIRLVNCRMAFDDEIVLDDINIYFNDKEFLTLLGPSGCGKTTTLRIIGGFLKPTSGDVLFDGVRINDVPPHKRKVNTVFQKYALFPHLDVYDNIAFGLRIAKLSEDEVDRRVTEMLEGVRRKGFAGRKVTSLSGGQQQRVAIARALVNQPKVLLLDEPLGALDLRLRKDMQNELKRIQQASGITFIYVTHDQEEARTMSGTVVVMDKGRIQQIGTPEDIYNEPKNAFVADFIGESNILDGVMRQDRLVEFFGRKFPCVDHRSLLARMKACYPAMEPDGRRHGYGPAVYYRIPGFKGSVGFISAIHGKFCDSCNRVRLTSQGYLKTCLCYEDGVDLRAILREGEERPKEPVHYRWPEGRSPSDGDLQRRLRAAMMQAIGKKPRAHCFERPQDITEAANMIAIGG